ncbi:MAG TPA: glycerate kinase [Pengzhenrongella sp.]
MLLAPDKFKGSASAGAVADALADGLERATPRVVVTRRPIADGGDGTVAVLLEAGYRPVIVTAADVLGSARETTVATKGQRAVVELASTCGMAQLGLRREPLRSTSLGLGLAVQAVIAAGYRDIVVGLGGSASTDGGLGMLTALGARGIDVDGAEVTPDGAGLLRLVDLDVSRLCIPHPVSLRMACDVDASLHGPRGAAEVFAPQKGASRDLVAELDAALFRLGRILEHRCGIDPSRLPGAGAAAAALGAVIIRGAEFVLAATDFDAALDDADLVITGEGSWDRQSAMGKGPGVVVRRAREAAVPVVVVAGQIEPGSLDEVGSAMAVSLVDAAGSADRAISDVLPLLRRAGCTVGRALPGLMAGSRPA